MKNRVKISIDGKSFTLVGEESEEHIRSVAAYIDEKMTEVREKAVAVTLAFQPCLCADLCECGR